MKYKHQNASNTSHNQLVSILLDPNFKEIMHTTRQQLMVSKGSHNTALKCRKMVRDYLNDSNLPEVWLTPLCSLLIEEKVELPPENGIDIEVGSHSITESGQFITLIRDKNGRLPPNEARLSIVITSRVSIDRIVNFIKNNADQILYWQKALELPPFIEMPWKQTETAFEVIRLKDGEGLTFEEISDKLSMNLDTNTEDYQHLSDSNFIKALYYRYKKYFNLK